jgi:hypothetical protein
MFASIVAGEKNFSLLGPLIMAGSHYGNYRSKLVHFEAQIFSMFKKAVA